MKTITLCKGGIADIKITSNLQTEFKKLRNDLLKFLDRHTNFLPNHQNQLELTSKNIVKRVVYGVPFVPLYYKRTYNTLASIFARVTQASPDKSIMFVDSDPAIVPALAAAGGYAKFIAGEGNGVTAGGVSSGGNKFGSGRYKIGFLRTQYGTRKSYFPRRFHEALENELPDYIEKIYEKDVLKSL